MQILHYAIANRVLELETHFFGFAPLLELNDHGVRLEHIFHVLHGVFPAVDFAFRGAVIELLLKLLVDDVIDVALSDIGHEGFTILLVNDHRSVYLVALPLALSAGYFRAFCAIFFSTMSSTLRS